MVAGRIEQLAADERYEIVSGRTGRPCPNLRAFNRADAGNSGLSSRPDFFAYTI
jgi:hypothetical protein